MKRSKAIELILKHYGENALFIFANGRITREAYVTRDSKGHFYMLSSMGKGASIGLGVAINAPHKQVVVLDGDGNALMNLDNFAMAGFLKPKNFTHIVLDDGAYATTGGQKTISEKVDLSGIARGASYACVSKVETDGELKHLLRQGRKNNRPHFILVKIDKDVYPVPRTPHYSPEMIRDRFMEALTP